MVENAASAEDTISNAFVIQMLDKLSAEFDSLCNNPAEFKRMEDVRDYTAAKEQIDAMQPITFGSNINVLLITDRLYGCATGLKEYLQNSSDITVDMVNDPTNAQQKIQQKPIDFLIVVGYLSNRNNYSVIQDVMQVNKYASVVMYANLDNIIASECKENEIRHSYQRRDPIDGFVAYMRQLYAEETKRMNRKFSLGATREAVRLDTIWEIEHREAETEKKEARATRMEKLVRHFAAAFIAAIAVTVIAFVSYRAIHPPAVNFVKEYQLVPEGSAKSIKITAHATDDMVNLTIKRYSENEVSADTTIATKELPLEYALDNKIILGSQGPYNNSYSFDDKNLLLYCLMELTP